MWTMQDCNAVLSGMDGAWRGSNKSCVAVGMHDVSCGSETHAAAAVMVDVICGPDNVDVGCGPKDVLWRSADSFLPEDQFDRHTVDLSAYQNSTVFQYAVCLLANFILELKLCNFRSV